MGDDISPTKSSTLAFIGHLIKEFTPLLVPVTIQIQYGTGTRNSTVPVTSGISDFPRVHSGKGLKYLGQF